MRRIRPISHEDRLSVVDHLDELRSRLIVSALAFGIAWGLTAWQNDLVLEIVNAPLPDGPNGNDRADHARPGRGLLHDAHATRRTSRC